MKIKNKFKKINLLFLVILLIFLLYSFDYSLGWGMNLMLPEIYLFTNGTGNSGYHPFIWNESGFIENIQALILFLTILQLIFLFFLKKNVSLLLRYFMILNIVGISYIFFEEISWGQHFFNYKSPEIFLNKNSLFYNRQGEFNLHNISNMFNEIPRALILIWCSLSIPILRLMNYSKIIDLNIVIEPNKNLINLSYLILLISLPDLIINKFDLIDNSKLFIFDENGFIKYDTRQLILTILSFNFIRFSELQELLIFYYFLSHSIFLKKILLIRK